MKDNKGLVLGITGGVGVGKSEVLSYLATKPHTVVYDLDTIAHELQEPGENGYEAILAHFGDGILKNENLENIQCTKEGRISMEHINHTEPRPICREALGKIVFASPQALEALNSLIHPIVMERVLELIEYHKDDVLVIEGALLLEAGYQDLCTEIWHIDAHMEVRRERVLSSRGYSLEKFESIVESQTPREELLSYGNREMASTLETVDHMEITEAFDDIETKVKSVNGIHRTIDNSGTVEELHTQLDKAYNTLQ